MTGVPCLLIRGLRRIWPETRVVMRAESAFCVPCLLRWRDRNGVGYNRPEQQQQSRGPGGPEMVETEWELPII